MRRQQLSGAPDTGAFRWQQLQLPGVPCFPPVYGYSAPGGRGRSGQHMAKGCLPLSWLATLVLLGAPTSLLLPYDGGAATARARSGPGLLEATPR